MGRRDRKRQKRARLSFADSLVYRLSGRPPVSEGEILTVKITETTVNNVGVARVGLYRISVPNTRIGDQVRVKIIRVSEREAEGIVLK